MTIDQKRETVVALLREIDRDHERRDTTTAALGSHTYTVKSTRLGRRSIERVHSLLTSYQTGTWGVTTDQLRDRLRIDALGVNEYGDPLTAGRFRGGTHYTHRTTHNGSRTWLNHRTEESHFLMTNNAVYITGQQNVDEHDYLARVLKVAIRTTENVVVLERQRRDGHLSSEDIDLSPRDLLGGDPVTLTELEGTLPSLSIEDYWQHESWGPGEPCPTCGGEDFSVIDPHEHISPDEDDVTNFKHGDASGSEVTERSHVINAIEAAADGCNSDELLGECTYNARRLYDELQKRDVTAHIIRGGLDLPDEEGCPTSITEAEDLGVVHWWVEALADGEWLTVDLAAEDPDCYGERLLTPRRPATYIPFEIDPPDSEMFATR